MSHGIVKEALMPLWCNRLLATVRKFLWNYFTRISALVWKCVHSWSPLLDRIRGEKTSICCLGIFGRHLYWWGYRYSGIGLWHCVIGWVIRFRLFEALSPRLVIGSNDPLNQRCILESGTLNYKAAKTAEFEFIWFFFLVPGKCVNIARHIIRTGMCHHETCKVCKLYYFEDFAGFHACTVHIWEGKWWLNRGRGWYELMFVSPGTVKVWQGRVGPRKCEDAFNPLKPSCYCMYHQV
jgi:hypothetical protein